MTMTAELAAFGPAAVAGLGAVLVLLIDAIAPRGRGWQRWLGTAVLIGALVSVVWIPAAGWPMATLTQVLQSLAMVGAMAALTLVGREQYAAPGGPSVAAALVLATAAGAASVAACVDVVTLVVSLELATVPVVALVALRGTRGAGHAALSLLVTSLTSFALIVVGAALWVSATGTVALTTQAWQGIVGEDTRVALGVLAMLILLSGIGFKLSLMPFHAWTPQNYREADVGVVAVLVTTSKAAALAAAIAVLRPSMSSVLALPALTVGLAAVALTTMILGASVALRQDRALGLVAWSTIAQAGWVLLPLVALSEQGAQAAVAYLCVYAAATVALLAGVAERRGDGELSAYRGLIRRDPLTGGAMAFALLVLAGLPPGVVGLIAKIIALRPLTTTAHQALPIVAVLAVMAVALGIAVFLRWLVILVARPEDTPGSAAPRAWGPRIVLVAASVTLVVLSVAPQLLLGWVR